MPEFFVWSLPSLIEIVEAESELDAAEEFLGEPATKAPIVGEPPKCFVQATHGDAAPRMDGTAVEFWAANEEQSPSV